ncbi:cell division protein PerM [Marmoricola sp. RAF53]|uniref:cell division protein PerM n=1 Tax=Marmoricola sp. RAF53 TaxID=3233059 RepID=UPI003F952C70
MTDLIRRPTVSSGRPEEPAGRPLGVVAAAAGALAAVVSLVLCLALALTAWFLADGGAHGDTTDALRAGAVAWLVGHGSHVTVSGTPVGMVPLGLTVLLVLVAYRSGRAAVRNAAPATDDRALGSAVAMLTCGYVVVAVLVGVLASADAGVSLPRTVLGAAAVAAVGGGLGLASGTGRLETWVARVPEWARQVAVGALAGALALVVSGAVLVAVGLLISFNEAATVFSGLDLNVGDALSLTVATALFAPNAVLLGCAYLLGPGFAFGVGTSVSPTAVSLGVVPAVPVLAALPGDGPTPGWLAVLMVVPAVCAGLGTALGRRGAVTGGESPAYDVAALRGAGAGFGAGVLVTLAIALAGGPLGSGRLAEVGAPVAEVLVFATGTMAVGGALAGLIATWADRRAERRR